MSEGSISKVVVVGGGLTAWTAAATLKRRIPVLDVQLVKTEPAPDALAEQIISTLPSIATFHQSLGLTDADTVERAASGIRLATMLEGFAEGQPDFVHSYDRCGVPLNGVPFHQLWLRECERGKLPAFDRFSPAAEIARSGKPPQGLARASAFGLQLDLERYGDMMRALAHHVGVRVRDSLFRNVALRTDDGFVDKVILADGDAVAGDLFVDCTGPAALLHREMKSPFTDWSRWLPCDQVAFKRVESDSSAELMDRVTALPFGWKWRSSSPRSGSVGVVYSSSFAEPDIGAEVADFSKVAIRQGRKTQFWVRNCVAIGDAAVTVEPLEWTNLHLVQGQLDRLITMMPGRDCAKVEIAQFNRETIAQADRVRDFVAVHYLCSSRPERFWKDAASVAPPASLEHSLSLFKERGLLPNYPEESFSRDSWLTILLGLGVRPRRIDPLASLVPVTEAAQAFASMSQSLKTFALSAGSPVPELNPHGIR
ncbi:MAG TPA: tryptophan 7-halogenase [Sphingomicrobium sp.]|nr:tryptophan 7-halogenase [Sphingomicrobium sp.]